MMSPFSLFSRLLRQEFRLLYRYRILHLTLIVSVLYAIILQALQHFGDLRQVLVLVIFNDPAILGFIFSGVMVLYEKDEGVFEVYRLSPISPGLWLWARATALALLTLFCSLFIALAAIEPSRIAWGHFVLACLLSSYVFSFWGLRLVAKQRHFMPYIVRAVFFILVLSLPFIPYFGLMPSYWFAYLPTHSLLLVFDLAFRANWILGAMPLLVYGFVLIHLGLSFGLAWRAYR